MQTFEQKVKTQLHDYLLSVSEIDPIFPETTDIEEKWADIAQAYIPDGVREFPNYPNASLGWMMYIGMAVAQMWDTDWPLYSKMPNLYLFLRDNSSYDILDEYIRQQILRLADESYDKTETLVRTCAQLAHSLLLNQNIQPGTEEAFRAYVAALHQLYMWGAAVQLRRMGYKMTQMK